MEQLLLVGFYGDRCPLGLGRLLALFDWWV
jgi:hypothetical protein